MKLLSLTLFCLLLSYNASAQTVNGIAVKDIDAIYLHLKITTRDSDQKVMVKVDYGQPQKPLKNTWLVDDKNDMVWFNSPMDVLNFMSEQGYDLFYAYPVDEYTKGVYQYILK